jgi:hypothetical protein
MRLPQSPNLGSNICISLHWTIQAVIGVAAFAGLREGEIRRQWWEDDDGKVLNIRRSVSSGGLI